MVLCRDFGHKLEINVLNDSKIFTWDIFEVPMVTRGNWTENRIDNFYGECIQVRKDELIKAEIVDAKHEKINIEEYVQDQEYLKE